MELELTRLNYGSVNTTLPNCLKLVSTGDLKKKQKYVPIAPKLMGIRRSTGITVELFEGRNATGYLIRELFMNTYCIAKIAVGDLDGNFQLFGIKKSEAQLVFQNYVGSKVLSIQISGVAGSAQDKIFVASDNVVKAFTKKGKMFLSLHTNLTEPIKCMFVSGADLFICGNHVYSHYRDCKEVGTYLCGDTIVDIVALCPNNTNRVLTILACSGRVLRILEHCRVRQTVEVESVPTVLHVPKNVLGDRVLCGFADGKVILYQFGPFTGEIKQRIIVDVASSPSAVTCMDTYDLSRDGRDELIIGRRDGTIQVFTMATDDDEMEVECRQLYRELFLESISAVRGGCVFSPDWTEIVVLLYSGNIFGLTTQIIGGSLTNKEIFKHPFTWKNKEGIPTSSNDLNTASEENTQTGVVKSLESTVIQNNLTSVLSIIEVNDSLTLDKIDKTYNLFIELPVPISEIVLESEIMINILNVDHEEHYSIAKDSELENNFSWKITMKENYNRFEMKFHTIEGQYGTIQALIIPRQQPHNVQTRYYTVRPLSLHFRSHKFDSSRGLNVLSLSGLFSHSEIHNWISQCIPEIPERLSTTEVFDLFFENALIGTILECKYGKGNAQFRSDNLSTISILKDFLTKEATKKRIKLEINTEISELSVAHVLKLIKNSIASCIKVKKEYTFLQALLQVDIRNDADFNCLMPEYQSILQRRTQIETDFKKSPAIMDRYFGMITDFYIDRFKFKGLFVKEKIPKLLEILENFDMKELLEFFNAPDREDVNLEII